MNIPELLAPAGGPDAFLAAVAAGADAVYLGLSSYSARAAAQGFTLEELSRACAVAHGRGVRVYVAMNILLHEGECAGALRCAEAACRAGADALIVADLGFAAALAERLPQVEVHLSTQAGVHAPAGVRLAARELGVQRVTCGRELSVEEIATLAATGVPIEAFCHGAICICYAGACAFSALRRGRSANRGDCTQPCRIAHDLVDVSGASVAAIDGDRLLCPRDYRGIAHVEALCRAGVSALKIEGRMKNPDYVYNVVRCYRAALDVFADGGTLEPVRVAALEEQLARSFNRGFTDAYLRGVPATGDLMSWDRAINQGLYVGRVVARGRAEVTVALERAVGAGDTLEIRSTPGPDAPADVPRRWPMVPCPADGAAGERVRVHCKRKVEVGSPVHVTRDAGLVADSAEAVPRMRAVWDAVDAGTAGTGTEGGMAVPVAGAGASEVGVSAPGAAMSGADGSGRVSITVLVSAPEDAARLLGSVPTCAAVGPDSCTAAVPAHVLEEDPSAWEGLLPRLTVMLDEACHPAEEPLVRRWCTQAASVICRNLSQVAVARAQGASFSVAAPIAAWNAGAVRALARLGATCVWLPDELSQADVRAVADGVDGCVPIGVLAWGRPQLMVCEHCVLSVEGPCAHACSTCVRRRRGRWLVEADGARLPVETDARGRSRIYAERVRGSLEGGGLAERLRESTSPGIAAWMVDARRGAVAPAAPAAPRSPWKPADPAPLDAALGLISRVCANDEERTGQLG